MNYQDLQPIEASAAAWIRPALGGPIGSVQSVVPRGFASHARILHPAYDKRGRQVSWSDVTAATGRSAHALMQWHSIKHAAENVRTADAPVKWSGGDPQVGRLEPYSLQALSCILADNSLLDQIFYFAIWTGYFGDGYLPVDENWFELPHREYLLFASELATLATTALQVPSDYLSLQSPNMFWPEDHSWFVSTEIDFDSTIVAGSSKLLRQILSAPGLDAWKIDVTDSLTITGDLINVP